MERAKPIFDPGYVYWNYNQNKTSHDSTSVPGNALRSYESLAAETDNGSAFIRTTINNRGEVSKHEACLLYNGLLFCMEKGYWDSNYTTTKNKLKSDMEATFGMTASCNTSTSYAYCTINSNNTCYSYSDGKVRCIGSENTSMYSEVYSSGGARSW